jgi:uncharacterized protein (TIGR02646 family)
MQDWTQSFIDARKQNPAHSFRWRSDVCYRQLRQRLREMTQTHCAFCDGQLGTESRETVEHFQPKSTHPELAYTWNNLFPCCDMCQSSKREDFDPALLKPDTPDYDFSNYFVANYKTGELEPSPHAEEQDKVRSMVTIKLYGLNLPARKAARRREWEHYQRDPEPRLDEYNYRFFLE